MACSSVPATSASSLNQKMFLCLAVFILFLPLVSTALNTSLSFYSAQVTFPDGVSFFSTRQRQYMRDYFTSAVP